jgi:sporulation protein YlmC with PRC-barrel domain
MFAKTITAALAGSALLATIASAQTPTTATDRANAASNTISSSALQGDWRASKVVGLSVYNDNNENLGSINDLIMDRNGNIRAAVLGVGGFLGMGGHLVAIPLDKIKFVNEPIVYSGNASAGGAGTTTNNPAMLPTTTGSNSKMPPTASKPDPWSPNHAVFNATKDELKAMPEFQYSN